MTMAQEFYQKTLRVRVKDKHVKQLLHMAAAVNYVWNYINALSFRAIRERGLFFSGYDLQEYTKGANKELGLHSQTPQMVGATYAESRELHGKARLKWRKTHGARRSLGWIPLNGQSITWRNGQVKHNGRYFKVIDSYGLSNYEFQSGCFTEDARGRWYFCVTVRVKPRKTKATGAVGVDLGCKTAAMASNGDGVTGRHYRALQQKLGIAQRANNKKRARAIHAKVKNKRANDNHQFTRRMVDDHAGVVVGNVPSGPLIKTSMAKSVLDAGWCQIRTMLEYKCQQAGVVYVEVGEAYTTQTCSRCSHIGPNSPKGKGALGIREWACSKCGARHDRDINAAKNILALGHERLAGGIPRL